MSADKTASEVLAEQKKRFEDLTRRRTRAQVEVEAAQRQLAEAQAEAERDFGTADLAALQALLTQRNRDNDQLVLEFSLALGDAEEQLEAVEKQLQSAGQG